MRTFERNSVFFPCVIVLAVAMALIATEIVRTGRALDERRRKVARQRKFFKQIGASDVPLDLANLDTLKANRALAEAKLQELRAWLHQSYAIPREEPVSSVECMRSLQQEIRGMRAELLEREISHGEKCRFFSFGKIATSRSLPQRADVPKIQRRLKIVREIVRLVGVSQAAELMDIVFPMDLGFREKEFHTVTPVTLTLFCTTAQVREGVSLPNTRSRYFFMIRSVEVLGCGIVRDYEALLPAGGEEWAAWPVYRATVDGPMFVVLVLGLDVIEFRKPQRKV